MVEENTNQKNPFVGEENPAEVQMPVENTENKSSSEIDLDSFGTTLNFATFPKEIGEQLEVGYKLKSMITKPGKMVSVEGIKPFWSGLVTRDEQGNIKEKLPEHYLILNKGDAEYHLKLISWETYFKFKKFCQVCKERGLSPIGFEVGIKRIDKQTNPKNGNIEMTFKRDNMNISVVGKNNEVK